MSFLSKYIIYQYNDSASNFIKGLSYRENNNLFFGYLNNHYVSKIKPNFLTNKVLYFLWKFFDPIFTNNILAIVSLILSIFFSYKVFTLITKNYTEKKYIYLKIVFSLLFGLSPYFLFRLISGTISLYSVFVFPAVMYILLKKKNYIFISIANIFIFLITAYYGYFTFLFILFWLFSNFIVDGGFKSKKVFKEYIKSLLLYITPLLLVMMLLFSHTIISNLGFSNNYSPYERVDREKTKTVYRPIEDFYNFTFRPWYFLIPPKSSLLFHTISKNTYDKIAATNYYLANDYQEEEMGGAYLGWHFVLGAGVFVYIILFKKGAIKKDTPIYRSLTSLLTSLFLIFLISGPPEFTISGISVHTPSYILYSILPGFRVLVRIMPVIYLIILIFNFVLLLLILEKISFKKRQISIILGTCVFILSFCMLAIKLPIIDTTKPPNKYKFLESIPDRPAVLLVLPNADYEDTFWILKHKNYLYNPRDLVNGANSFDSNEFSKEIRSNESGIERIKELDINYVLLDTSHNYADWDNLIKTIQKNYGDPVFEDENSLIYKIQ